MNDPRFEVYLQRHKASMEAVTDGEMPGAGGYGWRFRAGNGQISAIGGEGFTRREDAHRAVRQFLTAVADVIEDFEAPVIEAPVVDVNEQGDVIDPASGKPIV